MAVPPLRALLDAGFDVALVVTRADKRRGRGGALTPSPVKAAALDLGLPVSHLVDDVLAVGADLGVVVAFGQLIKPHVLAQLPMVNLHFSLLPRWRGAAPVERALLAGDRDTGVALMQLEEGLDTGAVFAADRMPIGERMTGEELRAALVAAGTTLLLDALRRGLGVATPQQGEPTYAAKLTPADLHLQFERPAAELDRIVRVGGGWTTFRGKRLKVLAAEPLGASTGLAPGQLDGAIAGTAEGALRLLNVQPEGKAVMDATAWLRGARPSAADRLGQ